MPIIRITKQDVEKARKAREEAFKKDPEFRASEEKMEKRMEETMEKREKEAN